MRGIDRRTFLGAAVAAFPLALMGQSNKSTAQGNLLIHLLEAEIFEGEDLAVVSTHEAALGPEWLASDP